MRFLTHRYLRRLAGLEEGERLELEAGRFDPETGIARFRVLGPERPTLAQRTKPAAQRRRRIDMALRERRGEWRIVALAIEGVELSASFRDQFAAFLEREDPDALLEKLRESNDEADAANPFEE